MKDVQYFLALFCSKDSVQSSVDNESKENILLNKTEANLENFNNETTEALGKLSHVKLENKSVKGRRISFQIGGNNGKEFEKKKMQDKVKNKLVKFMPDAKM